MIIIKERPTIRTMQFRYTFNVVQVICFAYYTQLSYQNEEAIGIIFRGSICTRKGMSKVYLRSARAITTVIFVVRKFIIFKPRYDIGCSDPKV